MPGHNASPVRDGFQCTGTDVGARGHQRLLAGFAPRGKRKGLPEMPSSPGEEVVRKTIDFAENAEERALVGDRNGGAVKLRESDGKLLVVAGGLIAKNAEGHGFAEKQ